MNRQLFQDEIVNKLLDGNAWVHDEKYGILCKAPTDPWIVFTAGVMVSCCSISLRLSVLSSCFNLSLDSLINHHILYIHNVGSRQNLRNTTTRI